jgi:hypothetical protein
MLSISKVSFVKRAVSVLTASMFLLSGMVLTAGPASAASTETVPYTYTVKVPVTKTVYEYQVVKTVVNKRTVYTYQKVAKTKTEYRIETRTGYREAPVKAADKPAAAQYKVQVSSTAAFNNVTKEILVTPSAPGTNKVNLSSQLSGSVGDTTYVRVVAKNAAGKSTPGKATKLAFGEVSRSNYDVQVPYTETGTRVATAAYWYTDYNKPIFEQYWVDYTWRTVDVPAHYGSRLVSGRDWYWDTQAYTAYRNESYTYYVEVAYQASYVNSYECGSWSYYPYPRYVSKTCKETVRYTAYRDEARTGTRSVAYTAYKDVKVWYDYSYWESYLVYDAFSYDEITGGGYYASRHTGGYEASYMPTSYENYNYTAYRTETRVAITNGWKAAN